jgi:1-acyl-sn-glycerol-3-phosphate acyltransferase
MPKVEEHSVPIEKATTLVDLLLLYAETEENRKHVFFQHEDCYEIVATYGDLLRNGLNIAKSLLDRGLKPADRVAMMLPNHPSFLFTYFGILLVNCIPVPIYPLPRPELFESFAKQEAIMLRSAEPSILVTFSENQPFNQLMHSLVPGLKEIITANTLLSGQSDGLFIRPKENDIALIQYASSRANGNKELVPTTHQEMLSNIRIYGKTLQLTTHDVVVNWTPLYRNLGLIGMWLGSLYYGLPFILMTPFSFLNRPERWLWAIHYTNGTISGGDHFAYELCIKKIKAEQIEGLDLSSWRLAIHFAEMIQPTTMEHFVKKFSPYGFKKESFLSMYGLGELKHEDRPIYETVFLDEQTAKRSFPLFEQIFKNIFNRSANYLGKLAKLIYTLYVMVIFLITIPPIYLCLWILPKKGISQVLHYWARLVLALIFCPIKMDNKKDLYQNQQVIYVANHTSYFDTLAHMALLPPNTKIVGKQELSKAPIIGRVMRKVGHPFVEREEFPTGTRKNLEKIGQEIAKGNSVLIFPEGTFSYANGLRPFKLGAFKIACETNTPVVPIAVQGIRKILRDGDYLMKPHTIKFFVGKPLFPQGKEWKDFVHLSKEIREFIAKNCGEPSLELIAAGKPIAEVPPPLEDF